MENTDRSLFDDTKATHVRLDLPNGTSWALHVLTIGGATSAFWVPPKHGSGVIDVPIGEA